MVNLGRWVRKDQATEEMGISLSTLDRMIRTGKVRAVRQERSVYVLVHGPEPLSDQDLLDTARKELVESKRAVSKLKRTIVQLERDLDTMRFEANFWERECRKSRSICLQERDNSRYLKQAVIALSLITSSLLVLLII